LIHLKAVPQGRLFDARIFEKQWTLTSMVMAQVDAAGVRTNLVHNCAGTWNQMSFCSSDIAYSAQKWHRITRHTTHVNKTTYGCRGMIYRV
jgi:hypothetical protein